jgi:hypothetical protein
VNEVDRSAGEGSLQPPEAVLRAIHVEVSGPLVAALAGLGGLFVYREIQWNKSDKRLQEGGP